jgi:hypothetical protein
MDSPSRESNTLETTSPELRDEPEEATLQETADAKRGIQWREIIRQAFAKARQTQQPTTSRRELSKDKSKSLLVLGGAGRCSPSFCYFWAYSLRLRRRQSLTQ